MSAYQLLRALTSEEYHALKDSIRERGILVPIEIDERGDIIDGHHRVQAWTELRSEGITVSDYPRMIRTGLSEEQKKSLVSALNEARRQLSAEDLKEIRSRQRKRAAIEASLKQHTEMSDNWHAEQLGVDDKSVDAIREQLEATSEIPKLDRLVGADGKARPRKTQRKANPPPTVFAKNAHEAGRATHALRQLDIAALPNKLIDTKRADRLSREHRAQERARMLSGDVTAGEVTILLGDFRERGVEIPDDSVDLIFTDPPYHEEYLPLWSELAKLAARVLKPGGICMAYSGQAYLMRVGAAMSEALEYVWTCGVRHTGGDAQRWDLHIRNNWKPIGMWIKPPRRVWWDFFVDMTTGGQQKEGHAWQQAEAEAEHYIRALCPRGGVVCDPMCGSGTTLAVSRRLGHPAIGIDIDPAAVAYAYQRLELCGGFARPKAKREAHDHW